MLPWLKSLLSFEANTLFKGKHLWISFFWLEMYCPARLRGREYIWLQDGSFSYAISLLKWKLTGYCTIQQSTSVQLAPQITRSAIIFAFIRFCCERKMYSCGLLQRAIISYIWSVHWAETAVLIDTQKVFASWWVPQHRALTSDCCNPSLCFILTRCPWATAPCSTIRKLLDKQGFPQDLPQCKICKEILKAGDLPQLAEEEPPFISPRVLQTS